MRRISALLTLVVLAALGGTARADGAVLCSLGTMAHQQGLFESAIDSYTLCLEEGDLTPEQAAVAYFRRASAWEAAGNRDAAIADYGLAIDSAPNFAMAFNNRGEAHVEQGDVALGLADFAHATALDPSLLAAWQNLGYQHWRADNMEGAIRASDTALMLDPANPQRYLTAALPRLDSGTDLEGALMLADAGLQLAPAMGPLHDLRGHVLALLDRPDDSFEAFRSAMEFSGAQLIGTYETSLAYQGYWDGTPDGEVDDAFLEALEACIAAKCDLWAE